MKTPRSLCVIIPAYNEELVIASSLSVLKTIFPAEDIYVVNDGSSDNTEAVALRYIENVLTIRKNRGKARAIEVLLREFSLLKHYDYVLFSDADSTLSPNFLEEITRFIKDRPACIVGKVTSARHGLISAFRTYEFGLADRVFKQAQSAMQVVTVAPGCSSLYRSDVLRQLEFSSRTLTEDFDLTLQIHLKKLGKVVYARKAVVVTQDPSTLKDYWKQITRWYTGYWQNLILHKAYNPRRLVFAEIWLILSDSVIWIAALVLGIFHPIFFLKLLASSYLAVLALSVLMLALEKAWWAISYSPIFPLFQFINLGSYIFSLGRAIRGRTHQLDWEQVERYSTNPN